MRTEDARKTLLQSFPSYKGKVAELSIGLTTNKLFDVFFDYLLYPLAIYYFGILRGGLLMGLLTLATCLLALKFYDWSKRDWLGLEMLKEMKQYNGKVKIGRLMAWVLGKSDPVVFLFLSIQYDPFITTVYLRHGNFSGMQRRDWAIFMGSFIISCAYWTIACYMGITLFEWAWKAIAS